MLAVKHNCFSENMTTVFFLVQEYVKLSNLQLKFLSSVNVFEINM